MKSGLIVLGMMLTVSIPAGAQDATSTPPATTTVVNEACAGTVAEICQDAQAQQQAPGVQKHLGFDPLPTPPSALQSASLANFTPPPTVAPAARPVIPQQPPIALSSTTVLPPPANASSGSPPVLVQSQPGAPAQ